MPEQRWELAGTLTQLLYSPKGTFEGFLLDIDGATVQFVADEDWSAQIGKLAVGSNVRAIGSVRAPSPKGEAEHDVYVLDELPDVADGAGPELRGNVVRFNYAKHGEPNGVILDSGHFLHTKPDGLRALGWTIGQEVVVTGDSKPLADGSGHVVDVTPGPDGNVL